MGARVLGGCALVCGVHDRQPTMAVVHDICFALVWGTALVQLPAPPLWVPLRVWTTTSRCWQPIASGTVPVLVRTCLFFLLRMCLPPQYCTKVCDPFAPAPLSMGPWHVCSVRNGSSYLRERARGSKGAVTPALKPCSVCVAGSDW